MEHVHIIIRTKGHSKDIIKTFKDRKKAVTAYLYYLKEEYEILKSILDIEIRKEDCTNDLICLHNEISYMEERKDQYPIDHRFKHISKIEMSGLKLSFFKYQLISLALDD